MVTALLLDSSTVAGRIIHKMMTSSTSSSTIALNSDDTSAPFELNSDNDNVTNSLTFNDLSYVSWRLARLAKSTWTPSLRFPDLPVPKTASMSEITAVLWAMASLSVEVSRVGETSIFFLYGLVTRKSNEKLCFVDALLK